MKYITPALAVAAALSQSTVVLAASSVERHHHLPDHLTLQEQGVQQQNTLQQASKDDRSALLRHTAVQPVQAQSRHDGSSQSLHGLTMLSNQAAACNVTSTALAAVTGSARIALLKSANDFKCVSDDLWKSSKSVYQSLFNQSAMIEIANEARQLALSYDGTNGNQLQYFVLYLRVGFWAQWGNKDVIGDYTQTLTDANHQFLDAFAANSHYYNTDETHAKTAKEIMILMNNFSSARYLPQAIEIIQRYDKTRDYYMQSLMTQALTLLFRGASQTPFRTKVEADRSILTVMEQFLLNNTDLLGHKNEFQFNDATNELGRFLSYGGETYKEAKPLVKQHLDRYSMTGNGATSWLKAAAQVDYADKANCSYYGTCNFKTQLEANVLPITHNCSVSLRVRA